MLRIYHAPMTRSLRVIWLCEELGLPLDVAKISFDKAYRFSDEWLKKHPIGKVPVLEDGDFKMFESGAMVQYILDRYGQGRLQPASGTPEHAIYLQWSWFAESTFARPLGEIVNHRREFKPELPEVIGEMEERVRQCLEMVNQEIVGRDFILGKFSAADIMLGYGLYLAELLVLSDGFEEVSRYWENLKKRSALIRTLLLQKTTG